MINPTTADRILRRDFLKQRKLVRRWIGVLRNPVRNKWVIEFGIIACVMVFPLALMAGAVRGIPIWWRLIDCTFGVAGLVPL